MTDSYITRGQHAAEDFIRRGVETWQAEGHIDEARVERIMSKLNTTEAQAGMLHLGAHFAISLPLRFPFGATARLLYTFGLRLRGEGNALFHHGSARDARRMHTFLVMLVALLPGFGRLAYFFSPALREERLLLVIPLDQASRKLPFRVYDRLHLDALFLYWGLGDPGARGWHVPGRVSLAHVPGRLAALRPYLRPAAAILLLDAVILSVGLYLFLDAGRPTEPPIWWFRERGLVAMLNVGQLLLGAGFGIAAYTAFWKQSSRPSRSEAAGIFLWVIGGLGLAVFAFDDFFTVHENGGDWLFDQLSFIPVITHATGDMLIMTYAALGLAVIFTFRMEIASGRPSATWLQLAAIACIAMVLVDAFATADALMALEFPAQTLACSLLLFAFAARWLEVRQTESVPARIELCEAGN